MNLQRIRSEPFRLFFPIGLLISVVGVSLWPLLHGEALKFHPGVCHARLMIQGFVGSFVIGFLGTAGPRLLDTPPFSLGEIGLLLACLLSGVTLHLCNSVLLGDLAFLALFLAFGLMLLVRAIWFRKDTPPPGFVLVATGLLAMLAGLTMLVIESSRGLTPNLHSFGYRFARLLAYEAFLTLTIFGVAPFLLPRIFGKSSGHDFPETMSPNASWKRKNAFASLVALLMIGGWALEAAGWIHVARIQQLLVGAIWISTQIPGLFRSESGGSLRWAIRTALLCLVVGLGVAALAPAYRIPLSHLLYVGGFGLITLCVATRVVFGHADRLELLEGRRIWIRALIWIVVIAAATRMSAEFWPRILVSHHNYAATLWGIAAVIWAIAVFPKLRRS